MEALSGAGWVAAENRGGQSTGLGVRWSGLTSQPRPAPAPLSGPQFAISERDSALWLAYHIKVRLGSDITRELAAAGLGGARALCLGIALFLCGVVVQSLSRAQLCDPMDCSTPGLPVLHHLQELASWHYPPLKTQAYFAR